MFRVTDQIFKLKAGEMTQWLKTFAAQYEDQF